MKRTIPCPLFHLVFCIVLLARVSNAQFQPTVQPIVNCSRYHPDTNVLDVFFGYASSYATTVNIPVGTNNFLTPGDPNRNQPVSFSPGVHDRVFFTSFNLTPAEQELTWFVGNGSATGLADPRQSCDPLPYMGNWNATTTYYPYQLVSYQGNLWALCACGPSTNNVPGTPNSFAWLLYYPVGAVPGPPGPTGPQGVPGQSVIGAAEPPGTNCTYGGVKYTDAAGIRFVCNGAPGAQGPPGNTNVFPSAQVYTFPKPPRLTIVDAHVTPNSLVILQYVGSDGTAPVATDIKNGQFTATGLPERQFRYVVIN